MFWVTINGSRARDIEVWRELEQGPGSDELDRARDRRAGVADEHRLRLVRRRGASDERLAVSHPDAITDQIGCGDRRRRTTGRLQLVVRRNGERVAPARSDRSLSRPRPPDGPCGGRRRDVGQDTERQAVDGTLAAVAATAGPISRPARLLSNVGSTDGICV